MKMKPMHFILETLEANPGMRTNALRKVMCEYYGKPFYAPDPWNPDSKPRDRGYYTWYFSRWNGRGMRGPMGADYLYFEKRALSHEYAQGLFLTAFGERRLDYYRARFAKMNEAGK